jgi:hypothetical protein
VKIVREAWSLLVWVVVVAVAARGCKKRSSAAIRVGAMLLRERKRRQRRRRHSSARADSRRSLSLSLAEIRGALRPRVPADAGSKVSRWKETTCARAMQREEREQVFNRDGGTLPNFFRSVSDGQFSLTRLNL